MTTNTPICVDLDGTLTRSDLLVESLLALIKSKPSYLLLIPFWLLRGKAALKYEIAKRIELNHASSPYRLELIHWLKRAREQGHPLYLCTASSQKLAQGVADYLGFFDGVFASDERTNLSGQRKAARLVETFGERGFDYCGNHPVDLAIWRHSRHAIPVGCGRRLVEQAGKAAPISAAFPERTAWPALLARACRLHQWAKNALVFLPLLAAHRLFDVNSSIQAMLAFIAFGLCASSVYLLNDMLDLEADRAHPRKSHRPFASGKLPLTAGLAFAPALLLAACALALALPWRFGVALSGYYALTLAYSLILKRLVLIDTLALAGLYTVRIVAGAKAIGVPLSFWMLLFSVFLFLSLAIVKRYGELEGMRRAGKLEAAGRGYTVNDLPVLQGLGTAAGYLSVLVLALYINSPDITVLYRQPKAIWGLCVVVLYWISRVWMKTHRGEMHDDPVVFALHDRQSLGMAVVAILLVGLAA